MKKYFLKKTGEELKFGEALNLELTKRNEGKGVKYCYLNCDFTPDLVSLLLEFDIIEEREVTEKPTIDFEVEEKNTCKGCNDLHNFIESSISITSELTDRVLSLEKQVSSLSKEVLALKKLMLSITTDFAETKPVKHEGK